jgi:hypothetical protein
VIVAFVACSPPKLAAAPAAVTIGRRAGATAGMRAAWTGIRHDMLLIGTAAGRVATRVVAAAVRKADAIASVLLARAFCALAMIVRITIITQIEYDNAQQLCELWGAHHPSRCLRFKHRTRRPSKEHPSAGRRKNCKCLLECWKNFKLTSQSAHERRGSVSRS